MVLSPVFEESEPYSNATKQRVLDAVGADYGKSLDLPASKLFGTDGIRGRVGDWFTPALAFQVGFCAGQVLSTNEDGPFILGWDSRNSSEALAIALTDGLMAAGSEVWTIGLCPTPVVAHLCHHVKGAGGVMISASHNPPEDNGIKFFGPDGTKLSSATQAAIEANLRRGEATNLRWLNGSTEKAFHRSDLVETYIKALHKPFLPAQNLAGLRVVLDLAWGAAAGIGADVFRGLGAEVICLHDAPNGDRINVNCGSTHLGALQAAVQTHQADLGIAFDGDADRAIAVDGEGRVVDGDYILYLWGMTLKQQGLLPENTIISTVMANLGFERAWQQQGGTLVRTSVGDQYVHAEMVKRGAMLGGEQSGHIICPHYGLSGDGLQTALHLASIVKASGVSLAELRDQSFQTFPQLLRNVRVEDRDRRLNWQQCEPLMQAIAAAEVDMGDEGRVLVRASGTEPVIRVMVEAASASLTEHWTAALAEAVQAHLT